MTTRYPDLTHCRFGIYDFNFTLVGWKEPMLHKRMLAAATYPLRRYGIYENWQPDDWEKEFRIAFAQHEEWYELNSDVHHRMGAILTALGLPNDAWYRGQLIQLELKETLKPTYVYKGVYDELLLQVHSGIKLGLACNGNPNSKFIFDCHGLNGCFQTTVFSCDIGIRKPDPKFYEIVVERLGANPARTFYVGDGGDHEFDGVREAFPEITTVRVLSPEVAHLRDPKKDLSLVTDFTVQSVAHMRGLFTPATGSL